MDDAGFPDEPGKGPPQFEGPPEPLEEQHEVEDFNPEKLHCVPEIQSMIIAAAKSLQVPHVMPLIAVLGVMAISVQKNFQVEVEGHTETLNLYLLYLALPSERKSAVQNLFFQVLFAYEAEVNKQLAPEVEKSNTDYAVLISRREALIKKASKSGEHDQEELDNLSEEIASFEKKHFVKLAMDDTTIEALTVWMEENDECMGLVSTEGGPIQNMRDRYKNGSNVDSTYLKMYSGDPYNGTRIGRKNVSLQRPRLTMCVAAQPVVMEGLMSDRQYVDTGMMSRFLFGIVLESISKVGKRTVTGAPISYDVKAAYECKVTQLLDYQPEEMQTLKLSTEAFKAYEGLFNYIEPRIRDEFYFMQDWVGKLPGQALRLAGILHCFAVPNPEQHEISMEVMGAAVDLAVFFLKHAKAAYGVMGSDPKVSDAKYILKKLDGVKQITKRDLFNQCRGRFKKMDELEPVIALLLDHNYLREMTPPSTGAGRKPSPILYINPIKK